MGEEWDRVCVTMPSELPTAAPRLPCYKSSCLREGRQFPYYLVMNTVKEIEAAIGELPREQFVQLIFWVKSQFENAPDRKTAADAKAAADGDAEADAAQQTVAKQN